MKNLLYILLFVPLALFGQGDLLLNYMNCIESHEQEISSIQSQIIENNNSLVSTQTQFVEVLAYCNMYSVEEQIYDYCYYEVESIFVSILVELEYEMMSLQNEFYALLSSTPCGDNPGDICMLVLCEDTYDFTTINADSCINPEHILGSTSYCCSYYFCGMPGCKDISACNYDDNAEVDDGSCIYSIGDCVENTIDKWYLSRDLESGWNMIGYGCPSPIDVIEGLSNHTESILITKDNNGAVYIPEWGFNGIGDFTPGFGYQIKLTEAIDGFSLCNWYTSDLVNGSVANIENENIILNSNNSTLLDSLVITQSINTDLQQDIELTILQNNILLVLVQSLNQVLEENVLLQDSLINIHNANILSLQDNLQLINSQIGCTDSLACNFDTSHLYEDGSCEYAEEGYDCDGVFTLQIGNLAFGGIIFYIDTTGEHGLVAALEDIEGSFEWGCNLIDVNGADGTAIGTGYQNTLDIENQGCATDNVYYVTAAQATLDYEAEGYSDWYLPSIDELIEMYSSIGQISENGNLGGFNYSRYWSSSEHNNNMYAYVLDFNTGIVHNDDKPADNQDYNVRPIRSF